ncbi:MAG: Stp1/IreP family PP2C-type Ser/Thr phosphatase [Cystobacterineae bacterium]|nr:Stp1/IreP family PP2C-type Ser/Thr phosphatase [Cystobacterineae bacterium]
MKLMSIGLTDVGRKRNHNEDSFLLDTDLQLFVVADGMGGHAGGGRASTLAVRTIDREIRELWKLPESPFGWQTTLKDSPLPLYLQAAVERASAKIFSDAQSNPRLNGMGTTVIALLLHEGHALFAHVGDSRAYLIREERIQQISEDHSLVNEQLKAGMITVEEAKRSNYRNIITRSVGFEEEVQVDIMGLTTEPNDIFILCSDGLANAVEDEEMKKIVLGTSSFEEIPRRLIALANDRGGEDNITVVIVKRIS